MEFFKTNVKELKRKDWIKEVQKALTKHSSAKVQKKENPAFNLLCQNATEINKHLTDIQTVHHKLNPKEDSSDDSDEDSDEDLHEDLDVDKDEEDKKSLIEEIKRLVKVMGDIAVNLKVDDCAKTIQTLLYDTEKGGPQKQGDESIVVVELDNLSDEQKKLSPFICFTHLPPEIQGNGS
jgi:hypothetical protein